MTTCYYKTDNAAVLAAWRHTESERAALQREVDEFAARFGAAGLLFQDPARFAGLRFTSPATPDLWTRPDYNRLQRPLGRVRTGASIVTRDALAALREEWNTHLPRRRVDDTPLYRALGYSGSMDFAFGGLEMFVRGAWLYAATGKPMPRMTEILGSEYSAAEASQLAPAL